MLWLKTLQAPPGRKGAFLGVLCNARVRWTTHGETTVHGPPARVKGRSGSAWESGVSTDALSPLANLLTSDGSGLAAGCGYFCPRRRNRDLGLEQPAQGRLRTLDGLGWP